MRNRKKMQTKDMETILGIFGELESLKSLVKLVKKQDTGLKSINLTKVEACTTQN
jgi:hypothetical protein